MKVFSRESLAGDERAGFCISRMNGVPHRPVRDDHVIGTRCKHSNVFSQGVLISRFLLGNLKINILLCKMRVIKSIKLDANAFTL